MTESSLARPLSGHDLCGLEGRPARSASKVPQLRNFCHDRGILQQMEVPLGIGEPEPLRDLQRWSRPGGQGELAWTLPREEWFRLEYHRQMEVHAKRWEVRGAYGQNRARTIRLDPFQRMKGCEKRSIVLGHRCKHGEKVFRKPVGCGMRWLCPKCEAREHRKRFKRLRRAMKMHQRAGYQCWRDRGQPKRGRPQWMLVTLTTRHTGSLSHDRETIILGWKRFRQWAWKRIGKYPFAMVWEFTQGRDDRGHLHAHIACLWPWISYEEMHDEWRRATDGESTHINFSPALKGPGGAAHYLAKYATKGLDLREMRPDLAARCISANYGQRLVSTSVRFWRKRLRECRTCGMRHRLLHAPLPTVAVLPFAVWDASARGFGVDCRSGPTPGSNTS